jgi:hypothetical protein
LWLLAVAVLATATPAMAGPITIDAGWYGFCFAGLFSPATAGCQNEGIGATGNAFTFNAPGDVVLKVTDAFKHGDVFLVYDLGLPLFLTSIVAVNPSEDVSNPDIAFADPTYSHGSAILGAGAHSIEIFAASSPFGGGGAYMEVETAPVPEPTSLALLGGAMTALGAYRRRQRRP